MAAGDILIREGNTIVFGGAGGEDVTFSPAGTVDGAGRESNQWDRGDKAVTPGANLYKALFYCQLQATPVLGQTIDIYLKRSNGTIVDNDTGTADANIAAGDLKIQNLLPVGSVVVDEAAAAVTFVLRVEQLLINERYIQVVMVNKSGASISATAADTKFELTELIYQGQS